MKSISGRPRRVTDAQVAAIMNWYNSRKTLREVAAEIGMPAKRASYVIARRGEYKQISPEQRQDILVARRRRMKSLRTRGWL